MAKNVVEMWKRPDGRWQRSPIRIEADFIPESLGQLDRLRELLITGGYSISVVNSITGWLVAKMIGEPDLTAGTTRARYRKILATVHDLYDDGEEPVRSTAA